MARKPFAPDMTRAWQRMLSGRRLDLLDPSALDVEIEDIAHGLARVARWNGQTSGAHIFSVAQHTLLVEPMRGRPRVDARDGSPSLLHDAPEYVIGDMISPFKAVIGGLQGRRTAPARGHPSALRLAARAAGPSRSSQDRRPRRGLSRATLWRVPPQPEARRFFGRDPGLPRV